MNCNFLTTSKITDGVIKVTEESYGDIKLKNG